MKKESILKALQNAGLEVAEEKLNTFLREIHIANDEDIQTAKAKSAKEFEELQERHNSLMAEIEQLKTTHAEEIKSKDDALAQFNLEEIEGLRKYKEDREAEIKVDKQNQSIKSFLSENEYSVDDVLLTYINSSLKPEFDDDFKITNGDNILAGLGDNAPQYKIKAEQGGATAMTPKHTKPVEEDAFLQGFSGNK